MYYHNIIAKVVPSIEKISKEEDFIE